MYIRSCGYTHMNKLSYLLTPFLAWFVAGVIKFLINSFRARRFAFDLIGYGGMPSNHSAIVAAMTVLIAFKEGIDSPAFGVAITLAFVVILDANSLRRQIGKHAREINKLNKLTKENPLLLRERMGHTHYEILAGVLVGALVGSLVSFVG